MSAQRISVTTRDIPTTCIARFSVASRRALTTAWTSREPDSRLQRADEHVTDDLVHVRETLILIFVSMSGVLVLFFLHAPATGSHNQIRAKGPGKHNRSLGEHSRTLARSRPLALLHTLLRSMPREQTCSK